MSPTPKKHQQSGVALVIILAFVVLLTGVIIAFFSRAMSERQISNSSASQTRVDILAEGAVDQVIGDLKQEIAAGSTGTTAGNSTIYTPTSPATAVPALVASTGSAGLENLVKVSRNGSAFFPSGSYYSGAGPMRASAIPTTGTSMNGRYMTAARWNKPILMPITSGTDYTPLLTAGSFSAPDWILVTRGGSTPVQTSPTAPTDIRWSSTGATTVVGRYAYAIYNEGGLLDANVAGAPLAQLPPPYTTTNTDSRFFYKTASSFADLSQIPGISSLPNGTADQYRFIDKLTGWRNYASASASGTLGGNYSFPGPISGTTPYGNYVVSNTTGFLKVGGTARAGQTDRMFADRQELIRFVSGLVSSGTKLLVTGTNLDLLNYFTHYSRALDQPSFAPDLVKTGTAPILSPANGGNDAVGGDLPALVTPVGDQRINPSFLLVRVTGTFTRNDGTPANIGEPLVLKRFALSQLAWITFEGPSALASANTKSALLAAGVSQSTIDRGTTANVMAYFGLRWDPAQKRWNYSHGADAGDTTGSIRTLNQVANLGTREPDFFEILKAALPAGSLAKTFNYQPNPGSTDPWGYQQKKDNSVDAQVIQIGANMIDQADPDSYSTRIVLTDGLFGNYPQEYRGVEDLPYLYRVREAKIMTQDSNPSQGSLPMVYGSGTNEATLVTPGSGTVILEPEIWNPHAINTVSGTTAAGPTSFRIVANSADPNTGTAVTYSLVAGWRAQNQFVSWSSTSNVTSISDTLTFSIPSNRRDLFREPTLLAKPNIPTGSSLAGPQVVLDPKFRGAEQYNAQAVYNSGSVTDRTFTGFRVGTLPMAFLAVGNAGAIATLTTGTYPAATGTCIFPTGNVSYGTMSVPGQPFPYVTYQLQYLDPNNQWVTYDEKYAGSPSASSFDTPNWGSYPRTNDTGPGKTFFGSISGAAVYSRNAIGAENGAMAVDPRTSRFGMPFVGTNGRGTNGFSMPLGKTPNGNGWGAPIGASSLAAAASQNIVMSARPDGNRGFCYMGEFNDTPATPCAIGVAPTAAGQALPCWSGVTLGGWYPINQLAITNAYYGTPAIVHPGMLVQNNPASGNAGNGWRYANDPTPLPTSGIFSNGVSWASPKSAPYDYNKQYFADADGIVRRSMAAYVPAGNGGSASPALPGATGQPTGLPTMTCYAYNGSTFAPITSGSNANEYLSRPLLLNRPFRTPGELGYVFSGTPWRNLDLNTPESASAPLLDVFSVNETVGTNGLVAGKVDLNTKQPSVLKSILVGSYKDELSLSPASVAPPMTVAISGSLASIFVNRTKTLGPLVNISELIGKWNSSVPLATGSSIDGRLSYIGFTSDTVNTTIGDISSALDPSGIGTTEQRIPRYREAAVRALSAAGQTRVWNLMIDLVAQTGRYPSSASGLDKFMVEGEQRYWVHVAIDRLTGQVIDKQIEIVKE